MADIVIVPTYDRPEYLWVCLEKLHAAAGVQDKEIWICEDNHTTPKDGWVTLNVIPVLEEARRMFKKFRYISRTPHDTYGNSHNVVEAMREACHLFRIGVNSLEAKVYLVEDDVMVMPDFFLWHEAVQECVGTPVVSCAERYNHSLDFPINGRYVLDESFRDPMAYIVAPDVYSSLGVCFPVEELAHFAPTKPFGPGCEQDILIKEYLRYAQTPVAWPYVPRCYHMGWYGYHRNTGMRFNGTLEEKVEALKAAMVDPVRIREMAGAQDIEAYPTEPIAWQKKVPFYEVKKYR